MGRQAGRQRASDYRGLRRCFLCRRVWMGYEVLRGRKCIRIEADKAAVWHSLGGLERPLRWGRERACAGYRSIGGGAAAITLLDGCPTAAFHVKHTGAPGKLRISRHGDHGRAPADRVYWTQGLFHVKQPATASLHRIRTFARASTARHGARLGIHAPHPFDKTKSRPKAAPRSNRNNAQPASRLSSPLRLPNNSSGT